uniref:SPIN-DOC-like zinc-finger domain-containing protein n=1 Tax=Ciona savignyi TaxID=51511 RepID=H2YP50_CIOSA
SKKRKVDYEGRKFNNEWCIKYFIVQHNKDVVCLICQSTIAVMKEYNIKRHYDTKHSASYDSIVGQSRVDKMQQMVNFDDGEFIKSCLEIFIENVSPEKKNLVEQISLSRFTMARRIDDLSENIEASLKDRISKCSAFSIALDESTDVSDTAQLVVFIRGVTDNFEVTEEFLDMASMHSTTTGQNICEEVTKLMNKFEIDSSKLVGITTDGAPSMVGKNNGFVKRFLDV